MSNRGLRIVWLRLRIEKGKRFRLFFPIPLGVFRELLDNLHDLMALICVFVPKRSENNPGFSVYAVKELILMLILFLGSITDYGPYDLVDVTADKVRASIKIR
ncbi:MAG: hypothetical protein VB064_06735 [Oscillospiraceae bacterium]|nr:hypothetical protein [Oscillospiraceae bacterium]